MTRIAQIENRGAALAWSPVGSHADIVALGSKDSGSIGFDDHGGDLEFFDFGITTKQGAPTPVVVGSAKTTSRFASIGWTASTHGGRFNLGIVAGGMSDGAVQLWDPSNIAARQGESVSVDQIATMKNHQSGAVSALAFNTHMNSESAHLLATGSTDGEVLITSLERLESPDVFNPESDDKKKGGDEITKLAWNSQVAHIVASACGDGTTSVWDLRQRKRWCDIRCEHGGVAVTDVAWNPTEGLHMVTASGDDRNPVMKLWDLRASTSMPLATLEGHTGGVLSLAWCPYDASLLLSCGKDNRTLLWDLFSLKPIDELRNEEPNVAGDNANAGAGMYGGSLGPSTQRRFDVKWSPVRRGVVSTCSFDRKVEAHSVVGAMNKSGRPPSWLKRPCGVACGFGGSVVSFGAAGRVVEKKLHVEEPSLKKASEDFEQALASKDMTGFCRMKAESAGQAGNSYEAQLWGFMQIIFEANARVQILHYLGFDPTSINQLAMDFVDDRSCNGDSAPAAEEVVQPMSGDAKEVVKRALLVGDFEAAVQCCFRNGNLADALVLSSCGGAELWAKTQAEYFARESQKRPFLSVVSAVINNQLGALVESSNPAEWQETLALLSTYGKSDEFPALCRGLGTRLEDAGDPANASLCHMCALDLDGAARYWKAQLDQVSGSAKSSFLMALHHFVEKVSVFLQAPEVKASISGDVAELFTSYATALADQGMLETAAKYCKADTQACNELRDRLYHSGAGQGCRQALGKAPQFPFYRVNVGVAPKGVSARSNRQQPQRQQQRGQQPPQQANADQLPPGWKALQDPSSGRTYYANQTTGESSWEKPAYQAPQKPAYKPPVPQQPQQPSYASAHTQQPQQPAYRTQQAQQQQPAAVGGYQNHQQGASYSGHYQQPQAQAQPNQYYQQQQAAAQPQQPTTNGTAAYASSPNRIASKYGDGFVSSSSHPELGQQYGNVGTSNPHLGSRGGIAAVSAQSKAPVSGTYDPDIATKLSAEHQPLANDLLSLVSSLSACPLNMSEQKQMAEVQRGVAILLKKIVRGSTESAIIERVRELVTAVQNKEYAVANRIQTGLVNSDWTEHKDWIKGMKFLVQLAMKRL